VSAAQANLNRMPKTGIEPILFVRYRTKEQNRIQASVYYVPPLAPLVLPQCRRLWSAPSMPTGIKRAIENAVELSKWELAALEKEATTKRKCVPAQTPLFEQGSVANAVYYVIRGKVQVSVLSKQGREGMIGLVPSGGFVGEVSLTGQAQYLDSAFTFENSLILKIPAARMQAALQSSPALSAYFTSFLLRHSMDVQAELVDHLFNSSEKRLARILLLLANFNGSGKLDPIPHMTQELLAERVGTTRSRISYFMNKFRRLGLVEYNGEIKVHSGLLNIVLQDSSIPEED